MHNIGENKPGSIMRSPVALAWGKGLAIREIAAATNLSIEVVIQELKTLQKAIVEEGAKSHGTENEF